VPSLSLTTTIRQVPFHALLVFLAPASLLPFTAFSFHSFCDRAIKFPLPDHCSSKIHRCGIVAEQCRIGKLLTER
jgi:hypothetical protein